MVDCFILVRMNSFVERKSVFCTLLLRCLAESESIFSGGGRVMAPKLNKRKVGGIAGAAALVAVPVGVAVAIEGNFNAVLEIASAVIVTATSDLTFGVITSGTIASQVTVAAGPGCTVTVGDATAPAADCTPATFTITGAPVGSVATVTLPADQNNIGGVAGLNLAFLGNPTVTMDAAGAGTYEITGTLDVPAFSVVAQQTIPLVVDFAF